MQESANSLTVHDHERLLTEIPVPTDGSARLLRLGRLAQELGTEPIAEEARELAARVSEGRFYVACVGQFKRGNPLC